MPENPQGNQGVVAREVASSQMPRELPDIYCWVTRNVLGSPPILGQQYLDELKSGVIFGGRELERWCWWRSLAQGIRVFFSDFQKRLLNRACIALLQLHLNVWSAIHCFAPVTEFLEFSQDLEVFLYLFTFFSLNTEGKTKKGYVSVRPDKYRKIFCLYEDSFHDFKGRFFKIFQVDEHRPFWLSLEGQGRFPSYWSSDVGMEYVPVTYRGLNAEKKDISGDILFKLFSERNLKLKSVLGRQSEAREAIVKMAGNDVIIQRLHRLVRLSPSGSVLGASGPAPSAPVPPPNVPHPASVSGTQALPEGGFRVTSEGVASLYSRCLLRFGKRSLRLPSLLTRNVMLMMPPRTRRDQGFPRERLKMFARWIVHLMPWVSS
ncbi:hypothetical protein PIB30_089839 [Stylosanthes scabra]|uniref:Uncharacterized protein n=1 Tax=Stylosanthes scabra TaxID=79078 RepID=A0ABU6QTI7_9FABA|nr:hypothetical protein [Stylosanthes scabra]